MGRESWRVRLVEGLGKVPHCRERKSTSEGAHGKLGLAVFAGKTRLLRLWSSLGNSGVPDSRKGAEQAI